MVLIVSLGDSKDITSVAFNFEQKSIDKSKTTQHSGVVTKVDTVSYANARVENPCLGEVTYHGVLTDVIQICCTNDMKFVLLKFH